MQELELTSLNEVVGGRRRYHFGRPKDIYNIIIAPGGTLIFHLPKWKRGRKWC